MKIKVVQKDLTGNVINKYESYATAAKTLGCNESTIRRAAKSNTRVFGKFIFENESEETEISIPDSPRILFLDIETSLLLAQVFQKQIWKAKITHNQLVSDYYILTWSAKWMGDSKIYSDRLTPEEVYNEDDKRIVANLWKLLDDADIVCGHNSDAFDIPNIFTRCVQHNYPPPSSFRQVDTLKIAQRFFGFTHNNLDALAKFFSIEGKLPTTIELWKECIRGNEEALIEMQEYNKQDVLILEKIYYKLSPYAKGLPNLNIYNNSEEVCCPTCGNDSLTIIKDKYFYTQTAKYYTYRCLKCGAISRSRKKLVGETYKNIMTIPK